jgi:DNA replication protein DnaC
VRLGFQFSDLVFIDADHCLALPGEQPLDELVDLAPAYLDGRCARMMRSLSSIKLLILDDWGMTPLDGQQRRDLMDIIEERYGRTATLITSQVPVDRWHDVTGGPTYADAILDRLVHNAHRINLSGDSLGRINHQKTGAKTVS